MSQLTPAEKAMIRRILRRERRARLLREQDLARTRAENARRNKAVDGWIAVHPEEFAELMREKRKSVPEFLSEKSAAHLARKLARNYVHDVTLADEE
jgi:hypothetical protein